MRLPDGPWGCRHKEPAVLPENMVGPIIEIRAQDGDSWTVMIENTVSRSETYVLVKDTGRSDR